MKGDCAIATEQLRKKRRSAEHARAAGQALDPVIDESWRRSRALVDDHQQAAPVDAEPDEVRARWDASPIRRSSVGVEEQLAAAAADAGLVAAITDEQCRILWTAGSRRMRGVAEHVGFVPGGRWDEASAGTNALGLALLTGRTETVFSAEHWVEAVQDWVCWSVPITSPGGRRLGVLDLSGTWDRFSPIAELAMSALGRLVESNLPADVDAAAGGGGSLAAGRGVASVSGAGAAAGTGLELRLLGHPEVLLDGRRLTLSPRQAEILAALAIEGPQSLDQLQTHVYGERTVSATTIKAEVSHLRRLLGGAIASRPYRLTLPVRVDALEVIERLRGGDLAGAVASYAGQLLPDSEAPFAVDNRHVIDVGLRRSLLNAGTAAQLLAYAEVHGADEAVLERAIAISDAGDPTRHQAEARLQLARR